ncbi:MAG: deoxyguanosinetriphosphate triphosphohydrolase [Gammaproteobacteria bacterium]|nr:deoxyguanosinetriphosphate triphosphohydrolase [Gammaproteobacteria bacterium]MDH5801736.1 deoxyguanosinetriphosphate triphosphohydrolase [Gammaproteobacteria bacterium]
MHTAAEYSPLAATDANTRGRRFEEPGPNNRSQFQRDRDRIVHCAAFRRLEYKTQVFVNHEGDMFRTRLTHTIEVAQIGRTLARALRINEDLTESIALAHDLGHTPFGHAGQESLNHCMREYGGFEHNMQSLRIVDELEEKYAEFNGLNLTFETREGILKHCSIKNAKQLGDVGLRFLEKRQPGLEAQIANIADEIAYNNHDVDDGLRAGMLSIEQLQAVSLFQEQYEEVSRRYPDISERRKIHEIIRRMINAQITDLLVCTENALKTRNLETRERLLQLNEPIVRFSPTMQEKTIELKQFLRKNLYRHYRVHRMSKKANHIISSLFSAFMEDTQLLPPEPLTSVVLLNAQSGEAGKARAIADYIAGMTDRYAINEHQRIFHPTRLT